jgi:hypothetical protein
MMRYGYCFAAEAAHQFFRGITVYEGEAVIGGYDVMVAVKARVHLIALECNKVLAVMPGDGISHFIPRTLKLFKARFVEINYIRRILIALIDIRPHRMPCDSAKVKMRPGDFECVMKAAEAVGYAAVVM